MAKIALISTLLVLLVSWAVSADNNDPEPGLNETKDDLGAEVGETTEKMTVGDYTRTHHKKRCGKECGEGKTCVKRCKSKCVKKEPAREATCGDEPCKVCNKYNSDKTNGEFNYYCGNQKAIDNGKTDCCAKQTGRYIKSDGSVVEFANWQVCCYGTTTNADYKGNGGPDASNFYYYSCVTPDFDKYKVLPGGQQESNDNKKKICESMAMKYYW